MDPAELEAYRNQMNIRVDQYKTDCEFCRSTLKEYLDKNHVLNDNPWWEKALAVGAGAIPTALAGIWGALFGNKAYRQVDDIFTTQRKARKAKQVNSAQDFLNVVTDTAAIEAPVNTVSSYIEIASEGIDILKIGSDYYTNIPAPQAKMSAQA